MSNPDVSGGTAPEKSKIANEILTKAIKRAAKGGETHTRLLTMVCFLLYLLALGYIPMSDALKSSFAEWGFYGSMVFVGGKTVQHLANIRSENK